MKIVCGDPLVEKKYVECQSATELLLIPSESHDLVITDPPFGNLVQYAELSDFFYCLVAAAFERYLSESFWPRVHAQSVRSSVQSCARV